VNPTPPKRFHPSGSHNSNSLSKGYLRWLPYRLLEAYVIEHKGVYTGDGSMGAFFSLLLVALGGLALWRGRS